MTAKIPQDTSAKPKVLIVSNYNALALSVLEILLQKRCEVVVDSANPKLWEKNTQHIQSSLLTLTTSKQQFPGSPDYQLSFISQPQDLRSIWEGSAAASKALIILLATELKIPGKSAASAIYVKDLYGPRMDFAGRGLSYLLAQAISGGPAWVPQGISYYPTFLSDAAKEIVRMLLSFGPPSDETVILGEEVTSQVVAGSIAEMGIKVAYGKPEKEEVLPIAQVVRTKTPFRQGLKETLEWGRAHRQNLVKVKPPKEEKRPSQIRKAPRLIGLALAIFLTPFILLTISVASLLVGKTFLLKAETRALRNTAFLARGTSRGAASGFRLYAAVPAVGKLFDPFYQASGILARSSDLLIKGVTVVEGIGTLGEKVLGDEIYDPGVYTQEIYLTLDNLYQEMGFLDGEINEQKGIVGKVVERVLAKGEMADLRTKTLQLKSVFADAPRLLGADKPATYLLLFQNNMELRPAGGFIGSLALVTFDGGRLSDVNVQDVYSLDGQLKGHVEPPLPIKEHLGEANWFLRDSNWDPDFPTSAARAEWFLGKELGKSVDGVVGLDLEAAKAILKLTGPVSLPDFDLEITADNLYEKTQSEVEESFFPGSHKKASFLTALARSLLQEIIEIPVQKNSSLGKALFNSLEEKHIQIFIHQKDTQRAISGLGFDGSFQVPSCAGNCHSDFLGVAEANVGVNKANYFLERSMDLTTSLEGDLIIRRLALTYKNTANPALGDAGRYKAYLRILVPVDSEVGEPLVGLGADVVGVSPDIKDTGGKREIGILFEVLPGQSKSATFSWSGKSRLSFDTNGEYRLYWRKQAGTDKDPISVLITPPAGIAVLPFSGASLTNDGSIDYNTNLARDLFSRISW